MPDVKQEVAKVAEVGCLGLVTTYLRVGDVSLLQRYHQTATWDTADQIEKTKMYHELLIRMNNFCTTNLTEEVISAAEAELETSVKRLNEFREAGMKKAIAEWYPAAERLACRIASARRIIPAKLSKHMEEGLEEARKQSAKSAEAKEANHQPKEKIDEDKNGVERRQEAEIEGTEEKDAGSGGKPRCVLCTEGCSCKTAPEVREGAEKTDEVDGLDEGVVQS